MSLNSFNLIISVLLAFCFIETYEFGMPMTHLLRRSNKPCDKNEDCITPNSYCYGASTCLCRDGFIAINQNATYFICLPAARGIGGHCTLDIQCAKSLGTFAMCAPRSSESVGNCTCRQGSHFKDDACYKTSKIGEKCVIHNNCRISSPNVKVYCTRGFDHKGICVCPPGYHAIKNGTDCYPTSELGGECTSDESCTAPNTRCLARCTCKEKFILNAEKNKCLSVASGLDGYCIEDVQCASAVNNSICHRIRRRCICSASWSLERNGTCYPSVKLDEPCVSDNECHPGSRDESLTMCIKGYCQCMPGAKRVGMECIPEKSLIAGLGGSANINTSSCLLLLFTTYLIFKYSLN